MITDNNYITMQGWMVTNMQLSGVELIVYAILYGFSQDGASPCRVPMSYLTGWTGKSENTVRAAIEKLIEAGAVERKHIDGQVTEYKCTVPPQKLNPLKNCTPSKIEGVPPQKLRDTPSEIEGATKEKTRTHA